MLTKHQWDRFNDIEIAKLQYVSNFQIKKVQSWKQCGETKFNKINEKNSYKQHRNSNKIIKMENLTSSPFKHHTYFFRIKIKSFHTHSTCTYTHANRRCMWSVFSWIVILFLRCHNFHCRRFFSNVWCAINDEYDMR